MKKRKKIVELETGDKVRLTENFFGVRKFFVCYFPESKTALLADNKRMAESHAGHLYFVYDIEGVEI